MDNEITYTFLTAPMNDFKHNLVLKNVLSETIGGFLLFRAAS
jgi:hypothetical protein